MSTFQRVIKYLAMGFAIFLAVSIIWGIASIGIGVISLITGDVLFIDNKDLINYDKTFTNVEEVNIDNISGDITIKVSDSFRVEAQDVTEEFHVKLRENGTLDISEYDDGLFIGWFRFSKSKITVYLPDDFKADRVRVDSSAGNMKIEALHTRELIIDAGAGKVKGNNIKADKVDINGGVGMLQFNNVEFKDAVIKCGIGELEFDGKLLGESKVDCGIGEIRMNIDGNRDDYGFDVDTGIGSVKVDGKKLSEEHKINKSADNIIEIDGGIGSFIINFTD